MMRFHFRCAIVRLFFVGMLALHQAVAVFSVGTCSAEDRLKLTADARGGVHVLRARESQWPRLVAEFETPHALLLSVGDWQPHHRYVLQQIASKIRGHLPLVVLCSDSVQMKQVTEWLVETRESFPGVYLAVMPSDTIWLRDFGPIFMQDRQRVQALDFYYIGSRPMDDRLPSVWARQTEVTHVPVKWTIQGGNLMSNGQGFALTTTRIFEDNHIQFERSWPGQDPIHDAKKIVVEAIADAANLSQLLVLEPLKSEETRHVDMFTTFLSPTDVLVAQLDPRQDPVNAAILERNVERLKRVRLRNWDSSGRDGELLPLTIRRIAIPPRNGTSWSAYTNAIIAKDLVLMPVFDNELDDDKQPGVVARRAIATYQALLPNHSIKMIDMTSMKKLQGELHCLSLHVPKFAPMPKLLYRYDDAVKYYLNP